MQIRAKSIITDEKGIVTFGKKGSPRVSKRKMVIRARLQLMKVAFFPWLDDLHLAPNSPTQPVNIRKI